MQYCEDCAYFKSWRESRPYGSTVAYENFAECLEGMEQFETEDAENCPEFRYPIDNSASAKKARDLGVD